MTWNTDISAAPKGRTITVMKNTRTKDGVVRLPVEEKVDEPIWVATKCGKVMKTHWLQSERNPGRWVGLASNEEPVAWQPFVTPQHPDVLAKLNAEAALTVAHLGIDDAGGQ